MSVALYSDAELRALRDALVSKCGAPREAAEDVLTILAGANAAAYSSSYHDGELIFSRDKPVWEGEPDNLHRESWTTDEWARNLLYNCITNDGTEFAPPASAELLSVWSRKDREKPPEPAAQVTPSRETVTRLINKRHRMEIPKGHMMLLTKEMERTIPPLYSNEHVDDPLAVVKFFDPTGSWSWFAIEGSYVCPEHASYNCQECPRETWADYLFFGLVDGHEMEMGYFNLAELQTVKVKYGLGIERDLSWTPTPLSEIRAAKHGRDNWPQEAQSDAL